jgi:3-keto-disaccharide hydrolase
MKIGWILVFVCSGSLLMWAQTASKSGSTGWVDIMPDESFSQWTRVAIPPEKALDPVSQWSVDVPRRIVICEGNHGHEWLRYNRELSDFIFHVEWRFTKREGLKGYNSGVFVRNDADGRVWHQAQVGAGNDGYIFGQTLIGGKLSQMKFSPKPAVNHIKPPGEWNTYEIRCEGPKITLSVNGEMSAEFAAPEVPKGYLGLEAEGFRIEFRNIRYKLLP